VLCATRGVVDEADVEELKLEGLLMTFRVFFFEDTFMTQEATCEWKTCDEDPLE